jgi:cyclase
MLRPRITPCILIDNEKLVKTQLFDKPKYIGDPINAVKIFNEKQADELIVLDISATKNSISPNFNLIKKLAAECRMPLCYGGGISSIEQVIKLVDMGVEKIAVNSSAIANPLFVKEMVHAVGSQSVVIVLDFYRNKNLSSFEYQLYNHKEKIIYREDPFIFFQKCQEMGAGEIIINNVNEDGLMQGYDLDLASRIKLIAKTPVTFLGGAGSLKDIEQLIENFGIVGAAAGSLFVFKGKFRAVLINYPTFIEKIEICLKALKVYNNNK